MKHDHRKTHYFSLEQIALQMYWSLTMFSTAGKMLEKSQDAIRHMSPKSEGRHSPQPPVGSPPWQATGLSGHMW